MYIRIANKIYLWQNTKNNAHIVKKIKIFNDPIYGFIYIRNKLVYKIIQHRYFQRLRRISQMGLSYLVYPGAHHTRFHHAIGCVFLMQKTIDTLRLKGIEISMKEEEALLIAILLHDIGHGPFSHALENSIVKGVHHEELSLRFMEAINKELDGRLDLAIAVFTNRYPRKFMNQLVSSQLDMDRLDYLKRDSFYTGVAEGNINAERLISMLTVKNDTLLLEEKGIYSAEKFIVARRMMYWMVYLHKTSVAAEEILIKILERAKYLLKEGKVLTASPSLIYFLENETETVLSKNSLIEIFASLDDVDILSALKCWSENEDFILARLCNSILQRKLPKVVMQNEPFEAIFIENIRKEAMKKVHVKEADLAYFVFTGLVENMAYDTNENNIDLLLKDDTVLDIASASDQLNIMALSKSVRKHYICYPK